MRKQLRLSGSGGQGVITAAIIFAEAAVAEGKEAVQSQSYGPEARGGASKSEVIIANALKSHDVPYRYEYPLVLEVADEDHREFHPDFYCLNLRTRQEYAWEHFGMMDDAEYAERAVQKLSLYSTNGYFPGKNLIITMESKSAPLSSQEINRIINEYLK